jgi:hypothetical protein
MIRWFTIGLWETVRARLHGCTAARPTRPAVRARLHGCTAARPTRPAVRARLHGCTASRPTRLAALFHVHVSHPCMALEEVDPTTSLAVCATSVRPLRGRVPTARAYGLRVGDAARRRFEAAQPDQVQPLPVGRRTRHRLYATPTFRPTQRSATPPHHTHESTFANTSCAFRVCAWCFSATCSFASCLVACVWLWRAQTAFAWPRMNLASTASAFIRLSATSSYGLTAPRLKRVVRGRRRNGPSVSQHGSLTAVGATRRCATSP